MRVADGAHSGVYLVASERVEAFKSDIGVEKDATVERLDEVPGTELIGAQYQHPLLKSAMPIIGADHVTAESGTGLVHSAPGHGMEDYEACLSVGIKPFSPCRFRQDATWKE